MRGKQDDYYHIHPLMVIDTRAGRKPSEIAICPEIQDEGGNARAICLKDGSLEELYKIIQRLIEKERVDTHGSFKLALTRDPDGSLFGSLDELLDRLEELSSYQRIIICCPLKFLECGEPRKESQELTKIIYSPRHMKECQTFQSLKDFYTEHMGDWARQRKNIHIYCTLRGAAHLWFDRIKNAYMINLTRETRERLRRETTYP